ncbi:hypothetical protein YC2023_033574 [Brassica napus]
MPFTLFTPRLRQDHPKLEAALLIYPTTSTFKSLLHGNGSGYAKAESYGSVEANFLKKLGSDSCWNHVNKKDGYETLLEHRTLYLLGLHKRHKPLDYDASTPTCHIYLYISMPGVAARLAPSLVSNMGHYQPSNHQTMHKKLQSLVFL